MKTCYDESFLWKDTIILNVFVSNNTDITIFQGTRSKQRKN